MAQLQQFVSNVPISLAKNLRFQDSNGLLVTQLLPIGMNGSVVADSPTTGYISRIGSVLSQQIDLYNQVNQTLQNYAQSISTLQQQVAALQVSGTTIPVVNGYCFTGNANAPITTVVDAMAQSACAYNSVFGTTTALMQAIQAEGAAALNVMPSYSIAAGQMQALSGWIANPQTLASSVNNLWLSYLDSRTALTNMQNFITPSCSNNIIDFGGQLSSGASPGFFIYLSGYSFPTAAYTDNGSTIKIADNNGNVYTTSLNVVTRSQPGADPLFVGISGTPLSAVVPFYTVTLNSVLKSSSNSCTKTVVKNIPNNNIKVVNDGTYQTGIMTVSTQAPITIPVTGFTPSYVDIVAMDAGSMSLTQQGYYINITGNVVTLTFQQTQGTIAFRWAAFK